MFTLAFWKATLERSLSTAAQAALLSLGTDVVQAMQVDAFRLDFVRLASYAAGGALLAALKGIAAARLTGSSGPGFGDAETLTPDVAAVEPDPVKAPGEFVAGPAATVPEGARVVVVDAPADSSVVGFDDTFEGEAPSGSPASER